MINIHDLSLGQIVFSKSGRDKGFPFIIVGIEGNYVWLADGKMRHADKPKMKKRMHIQPLKTIATDINRKITERFICLQKNIRTFRLS